MIVPDIPFKEAVDKYPFLTERRLRSLVAKRAVRFWKQTGRLHFRCEDLEALPVVYEARQCRRHRPR